MQVSMERERGRFDFDVVEVYGSLVRTDPMLTPIVVEILSERELTEDTGKRVNLTRFGSIHSS
jgi:hypothetical protein